MLQLTAMPSPGRGPRARQALATGDILSNVIWLVSQLDDEGLDDVRDLPLLELAKHVSVARRGHS